MIAVDSSVWIAHFRNAVSNQVRLLRSLFGQEELLVGDIVLMEVLRGARDEPHAARLGCELRDFEIVPMLGEVLAAQLDFIEKCTGSAADEAMKDGFVTEHLIGTLKGEPESSEVTEVAPASPHVGPVEQLEAI